MYAVGISLLMSVPTIQESLIVEPYINQRRYPQGTPVELGGASLTPGVLFSARSILVLIVVAMGFRQWGAGSEMVAMTSAIAGAMPFALTRMQPGVTGPRLFTTLKALCKCRHPPPVSPNTTRVESILFRAATLGLLVKELFYFPNAIPLPGYGSP